MMMIPPDEQERLFAEHLPAAWDRLCATLLEERGQIQELALDRLRNGVADYGDAVWHATTGAIRREILEELADALVYSAALDRSF